jgi:hypothetical protein
MRVLDMEKINGWVAAIIQIDIKGWNFCRIGASGFHT